MSYSNQPAVGNWFTDFVKDPVSAVVSLPGKAIDAAAGGPQQRARAKATNAQTAAVRSQAEIAQQDAADAAAQATQQAAARVTALEAAAATEAAASKKKLIKVLAIGGGATLALGGLIWFITKD